MKKVLVVGPSSKTRGGVTSVINAYSGTQEWNEYSCHWIETQIDRGVFQKLGYFFRAIWQFLFHVNNSQLIHIHLSEPVSALRKTVFFVIAKLLRKKVILHFHAFSIQTTINGKFGQLYRYLFTKCDQLIVLTDSWKNDIQDKFGKGLPIHVIYNPSNIVEGRNPINQRDNTILFAGTLSERKGFIDLINAFALISEKHGNWRLILAGNGELDKGKELVSELGISSNVVFSGWVVGEDKELLFNNAKIFCLPSYAEGLPMAILDALGYGVPIVTTPVGGIPDVLTNRETALFVPPGDVQALSLALDTLMSDPQLIQQLSDSGTSLAIEKFGLKEIMKKIANIYESN
ncbi:glycosyltransferase family 4 protein [Pedobacter psychrodurus]|uniref:glycosyltransferase family 4 protein n=1 Tax=Pedobacter psychrodurus TaxID=2530456 RepID=UPI0029310B08|nr:glycosyltransferase family 4 protein [Pedobacter psychrodurus]